MSTRATRIIGIVFTVISLNGFGQSVEFNLIGDNLDEIFKDVAGFDLTLGVHADATVGPELDDFDVPGSPPQLFATFKGSVLFDGNETLLIEEFQPTLDGGGSDVEGLVWRLRLEFGDISKTGKDSSDITLGWEESSTNQFHAFTAYEADLIDGAQIIDMKEQTSYTFTSSTPNEVRTVYIVLRMDANKVPVAVADATASVTNGSVEIDVLNNDFDLDGGTLVVVDVVDAPASGTAVLIDSNTRIRYTPNADFTGTDEFTYRISDGADTSLAATVNVIVDDVVFIRNHESQVVNDDGLDVEVTVSYAVGFSGGPITLEEVLPPIDDATASYTVPSGSGTDGFDISGEQPETATESGNVIKFVWGDSQALPTANPFTFNYTIINAENADDVIEKQIVGSIKHGMNTDGPSLVTRFTPGASSFHPADSDENGRISAIEYLLYAGPAADAFQKGASGQYCFDGTTLLPDATGSSCSGQQVTHPADTNGNARITAIEYLIFAGPAADVFQKGASGAYCWDGMTLTPDTGGGCGN